jgi:hypothetical protein
MDIPYKSHLITATAFLNPETNRWTPRLLIVSEGGGIVRLEGDYSKPAIPQKPKQNAQPSRLQKSALMRAILIFQKHRIKDLKARLSLKSVASDSR